MRGRPNDELVDVLCTHHTVQPVVIARAMRGSAVWVPTCRDDRGRMRTHYAPKDGKHAFYAENGPPSRRKAAAK